MKPPMIYYGGKTRLASRIAPLLPEHKHYVEPFAGSLAVLLAKTPSKHETVNDLDGDLMTFWRVLRDQPDDLARACALTPHSRAEQLAALEPATGDVERARRLWVLLSQGRGGRNGDFGWRFTANPEPGNLGKTLLGYVGRFGDLAERLAYVSLECRPALELVERYGQHPEVCLYVDPPYLAGVRNGAKHYKHEMPQPEQHVELLDALRACRASVVLSGYASDLYAETLADWHTASLRAVTGQGENGTGARTEVLWSNRPLPQPAPVLPALVDAAGSGLDEVPVAG